jgi:hypothetical protein
MTLDCFKIEDFDLRQSGMCIWYRYNNEEYKLIATPEQAAELFEKCGFINSYSVHDGMLCFEYEDDNGKLREAAQEWAEFIQFWQLSQYKCLLLAYMHESIKQIQGFHRMAMRQAVPELPPRPVAAY